MLLEDKTATISSLQSENERLQQAIASTQSRLGGANRPHDPTSVHKVAQGLWMLEEALQRQQAEHSKWQQEQEALLEYLDRPASDSEARANQGIRVVTRTQSESVTSAGVLRSSQ